MHEFKKSKTIDFSVIATIKWACPHCDHVQTTSWNAGPYIIVADDGVEEMCEKCKEFVKLNFYENDDE